MKEQEMTKQSEFELMIINGKDKLHIRPVEGRMVQVSVWENGKLTYDLKMAEDSEVVLSFMDTLDDFSEKVSVNPAEIFS